MQEDQRDCWASPPTRLCIELAGDGAHEGEGEASVGRRAREDVFGSIEIHTSNSSALKKLWML